MRRLAALLILAAAPALAADRHVFLDTDADDKLNQCPNPAHNTFNSASTGNLQYCPAGANAGKIIGDKTGYVASCPSSTITDVPETGVTADIDGDGTTEAIYGHPQACAWAMTAGAGDSCEVHAGTYSQSGALADNWANGWGLSPTGSASGCNGQQCWYSSLALYGFASAGYGTAGNPGYVRGAVMNGETDTWDRDGDKIPDCNGNSGSAVCPGRCVGGGNVNGFCASNSDCPSSTCGLSTGEGTSYPAIMSGDRDGDGVFDQSTCSGGVGGATVNSAGCSGDAFSMVIVGCGSGSYGWCKGAGTSFPWTNTASTSHGPFIDTNADGTFDTQFAPTSDWNPEYITIKDLVFTRYNQGTSCNTSGGCQDDARQGAPTQGHVLANGDGSTTGIVFDHIMMHNSDYPLTPALQIYFAMFADSENKSCNAQGCLEIKNSLLFQTNELMMQAEGSDRNGGSLLFHDNRVIIDVIPTAAGGNGNSGRGLHFNFAFWKQYNNVGSKLVRRIYNNEFIMARSSSGYGPFIDFGGFCGPSDACAALPELWIYGNVFRSDFLTQSGNSPWQERFFGEFGHGDAGIANKGVQFMFNNTFDFADIYAAWLCGDTTNCLGTGSGSKGFLFRHVQKNNAYFAVTRVHEQQGTTEVIGGEVCSVTDPQSLCTQGGTSRPTWFAGDFNASLTLWNGLTNYKADSTGPLFAAGSCDPDGDGALGFDKDGDGDQDTIWTDIAGNTVDCTSGGSIDAGAIQSGTDTGPGGDMQGCTIIVATNGSDANSGLTLEAPKATLQAGFALAAAGNTVCMREGTYSPTCSFFCGGANGPQAGDYMRLANSGTAGSPITVKPFPTDANPVIIDGSAVAKSYTISDSAMGSLVNIRGSYVTFQNIEVKNAAGVGIRIYDPSDNVVNDVIVQDLSSHDNYGIGIDLFGATNCTVRRTTTYNNADCGPIDINNFPVSPSPCTAGTSCSAGTCAVIGGGDSATDGDSSDGIHMFGGSGHLVYDNLSYNNSDDGYDFYRAENVTAYRNIARDNGRCTCGNGAGMKTGGLTGATGGDNLIYNNLSYDNYKNGYDTYGSGGTEFYHNVAYRNGKDGFSIPCQSDATPNVMRNNISWLNSQRFPSGKDFQRISSPGDCSPVNNIDPTCTNNLYGTITNILTCTAGNGNVIGSDPLFTDGTAPGYDFRLSIGSPATGAGQVLTSVGAAPQPDGHGFAGTQLALDYILNIRPTGGWDIGPYESTAVTTAETGKLQGVSSNGVTKK